MLSSVLPRSSDRVVDERTTRDCGGAVKPPSTTYSEVVEGHYFYSPYGPKETVRFEFPWLLTYNKPVSYAPGSDCIHAAVHLTSLLLPVMVRPRRSAHVGLLYGLCNLPRLPPLMSWQSFPPTHVLVMYDDRATTAKSDHAEKQLHVVRKV